MLRFALDLVRWKHRWIAPIVFGGLLLAWSPGRDGATVGWAFGYSMGMAFLVGPQLLNPSLMPRPIWYLPISKRDIWRVTWLLATLGATLFTSSAKLLVMLIRGAGGSFTLSTLVLSSLYDFAYTGLGCALILIVNQPGPARGPLRPVWPVVSGVAEVLLPFGLIAGFLGGQVIAQWLPLQWSDMTARGGTALAVAVGLTIAAYFESPALPAHPGRLFWSQRTPVKSGPPRFVLDQLSGLPRLLVHEAAWTLMLGGFLVAGSVIVVIVAAQFVQSPEGVGELLRAVLLRFGGRPAPALGRGLDAFLLLIVFAVFVATLIARFPAMLRHLRVLPLGGTRINALLIAWPAGVWLAAWTGLLALHYLVIGEGVASYPTAMLLGLIGFSALVRALTMRLSTVLRALVFTASVGSMPLLVFLNTPSPRTLTVIGVVSLAVAAALNHRSLAREWTYTPVEPTLGVPARHR